MLLGRDHSLFSAGAMAGRYLCELELMKLFLSCLPVPTASQSSVLPRSHHPVCHTSMAFFALFSSSCCFSLAFLSFVESPLLWRFCLFDGIAAAYTRLESLSGHCCRTSWRYIAYCVRRSFDTIVHSWLCAGLNPTLALINHCGAISRKSMNCNVG